MVWDNETKAMIDLLLKQFIDSKNYGTIANKGILAVTMSYAIFSNKGKREKLQWRTRVNKLGATL